MIAKYFEDEKFLIIGEKEMNTKGMSKIRNKAKAILVEWLKTLLNEEEQKKVNIKNILTLLPNQTHYFSGYYIKITTLVLQMGSQEVKTQPRVDNR